MSRMVNFGNAGPCWVALLLGLILTLVPVLVHGEVANLALSRTALYTRGARYAQTPILLIDSAVIAAVDAHLRRGGIRLERVAHATAAALLVAVLGTQWGNDFRYADTRASSPSWSYTVVRVERSCRQDPRRLIYVLHVTLSCSQLIGVSGPGPVKLWARTGKPRPPGPGADGAGVRSGAVRGRQETGIVPGR